MNDPVTPDAEIPRPRIKRVWWPNLLIWMVPIAALAIAFWYYQRHREDAGPDITIEFRDGTGLSPDGTPITLRGVPIGEIRGLVVNDELTRARVHVRLQKKYARLANEGTKFWILRPQISSGDITGLSTVLTGPHIEVIPGEGNPKFDFQGLESRPLASGNGLHIVLKAPRIGQHQPRTPIYFRGVKVGFVDEIKLSPNANNVDLFCYIYNRYRDLVHTDSQFWSESAADVKGGIFSGVELKLGSVKTLLAGGISFATPGDKEGKPTGLLAGEYTEYILADEPHKDWLNWTPRIPIDPRPVNPADDFDVAPSKTPKPLSAGPTK